MTRVLLADDSPHAQRMGERILREEGYEVVTVTDGETALIRLDDVSPDLVIADVGLPLKSGYEICRAVKAHPRHKHARVVLTAGLLKPFNSEEAKEAESDGLLRKPFEASVMLDLLRPLVDKAVQDKTENPPPPPPPAVPPPPPAPEIVEVFVPVTPSPELVRAAVTLALDAALPAMIDQLTEQVLKALEESKQDHAR